jgi:hypothetical protein
MATLCRTTFRTVSRLFLPLLCILLMAGCAKTIDGSSDEAYKASLTKIAKSLPDDRRLEFQNAVGLITVKSLNLAALLTGKMPAGGPSRSAREMLNGKTVDQVLHMAEEIRQENEKRRAERQAAPQFRQPMPTPPPAPAGNAAPAAQVAPAPQA